MDIFYMLAGRHFPHRGGAPPPPLLLGAFAPHNGSGLSLALTRRLGFAGLPSSGPPNSCRVGDPAPRSGRGLLILVGLSAPEH
jgi:hypothetical protein